MVLKGERVRGTVWLTPLKEDQKIVDISRNASKVVAGQIREQICPDCPAFDIKCLGAGRISPVGQVKERKTGKTVTYDSCAIPGSSIIYDGFGIQVRESSVSQA